MEPPERKFERWRKQKPEEPIKVENDCIAPEGFTSSVGQLLPVWGRGTGSLCGRGADPLFAGPPGNKGAGIRGHLARRGAYSAHWLGAGDACRRGRVVS